MKKKNISMDEVTSFLKERYGNISGLFDDNDKKRSEDMVLSAIKEFTGFSHERERGLFLTYIQGIMFGTGTVELKEIDSMGRLLSAIGCLNDVYDKRRRTMELAKEIVLPDRLYEQPKQVRDLTRENVLDFLEGHGVSEKELFDMDMTGHREIVYDMYRTFTGCIPDKKTPGGISVHSEKYPELGLFFNGKPDIKNNRDLFAHIREMGEIKGHIEFALEKDTPHRLDEFKKWAKEIERQHGRSQDLER